MLRSLKTMFSYELQATDGEIGKVADFYFDDLTWYVRYLVADTGSWLAERQVLLSPLVLGWADAESKTFNVALTREQVEASPPIERDMPVDRQVEAELHRHYAWVPYWQAPFPFAATSSAVVAAETGAEEKGEEQGDPHLHSVREVTGYHIYATDGDIGHVDDLVVEDDSWVIRYLVVDTGNWLPGKRVLMVPSWVQQVDWLERMVYVDLKRESIRNSPEFDPREPVNRDYEERLYDYYGRRKYWEETE
ncbi:MAG TPA: PRC-barrel domain-containing protein [Anaerolineae bacterium]|nr:PRC-barrel domain-containing protein [Anaerolineae bacterium]